MTTAIPEGARAPTFLEATISLVSLITGITTSILVYGLDAHIPMVLGVIVASVMGLRCGFKWHHIQEGMVRGITNAIPAVIILLTVGMLIGVWILGGVVPTLIFYGLELLSPAIFLPATLLICSITSLATGTSWGTTGTIGVALIGVGGGLGIPLPLVAGAVLSGAYFGDKMSPLSDTTNMAPAMAGTDLYTHIKHMTYTTSVSYALTFLIEVALSLKYHAQNADVARVDTMMQTLQANYVINPVMFIAPLVVLVVSYKKMPAIPGITLGVIVGGIFAATMQGASWPDILTAAMYGVTSETGIEDVDNLLSRGGMNAMTYTISLTMIALMFGGVMERTNQLKVLADSILSRAKSNGGLIAATALTGVGANTVLCDQYMSIVITGRTYAEAYRDRGLAPENLSRAVEDSSTVTDPLVPWSTGGTYQTATLGVSTLAYMPFAFFCWLSPIVTILYGWFNITIKPLSDEDRAKSEEISRAAIREVS